jgi:hypothetical protein
VSKPPGLLRRPAFWLIVILVVVIPAVAFYSSQWLLRELGPEHPHGSRTAAAAVAAHARP